MHRITQKELENNLSEKGFDLVSPYCLYENNQSEIEVECQKCNQKFKRKYYLIRKKVLKYCTDCTPPERRKFSLEEIQTKLSTNGFTMISDYGDYKTTKALVILKCLSCNHEFKNAIENVVTKTYGCPSCNSQKSRATEKRKNSEEVVHESLRAKNFELVSNYCDYKNCKTILNIRCLECGQETSASFSTFDRGNFCCSCCKKGQHPSTKLEHSKQYRLNENNIMEILKAKGLVLLNCEGYKNKNSEIEYMCSNCGLSDIKKYSLIVARQKKFCIDCTIGDRKLMLEEVKKRLEEKNLQLISDFSKYKLSTTVLEFKCIKCSDIIKTSVCHISRANWLCPTCSPPMQRISEKTRASELYLVGVCNDRKIEMISDYEDYKNKFSVMSFRCLEKNHIFDDIFVNVISRTHGCTKCNPKSIQETEIFDFVRSIAPDAIQSCRTLIAPKEVDIFVPSANLAIEFNGLYWHSEKQKEKDYHLRKTKECAAAGATLLHIWEDQWSDETKREILKSMIRYRLNAVTEKIGARKCKVVRFDKNNQFKNFFEENHISGHVQSTKAFALLFENEIVACLSVRKPFHKKWSKFMEIARFAIKKNATIPGGFQRLLKEAIADLPLDRNGLLTYADLSHGDGGVYVRSGFEQEGSTDLDYWYTDFVQRFNRFKFRAQPGKTEKEVTEEAGVCKIFGCGSNRFLLRVGEDVDKIERGDEK